MLLPRDALLSPSVRSPLPLLWLPLPLSPSPKRTVPPIVLPNDPAATLLYGPAAGTRSSCGACGLDKKGLLPEARLPLRGDAAMSSRSDHGPRPDGVMVLLLCPPPMPSRTPADALRLFSLRRRLIRNIEIIRAHRRRPINTAMTPRIQAFATEVPSLHTGASTSCKHEHHSQTVRIHVHTARLQCTAECTARSVRQGRYMYIPWVPEAVVATTAAVLRAAKRHRCGYAH